MCINRFYFILASDISSLIEETKFWLLLARIYQLGRDPNESLEIFGKAKEMQSRYGITLHLNLFIVRLIRPLAGPSSLRISHSCRLCAESFMFHLHICCAVKITCVMVFFVAALRTCGLIVYTNLKACICNKPSLK